MNWREHITVNAAVLHGKACIRGESYPTPTAGGIRAALAYAADLAHERVLPLPV
jgi:uncharacterized protein (DUF433 family)